MKKALYEAVLQDVGRYEDLARRAEGSADDELAGFSARYATRTGSAGPRRPGGCWRSASPSSGVREERA